MTLRHVPAIAMILLPSLAVAQNAEKRVIAGFGAGLVATSGLYAGQRDEVVPFPILTATYGNWTADLARGVRYTALSTERAVADFGLRYDFAPDLPDTPLFEGLDRDGNVEFVASLAHRYDHFDVAAELGADASSVHGGVRASLSVGRAVPVGLVRFEGRLGAEYLDADLGGHLYGVAPAEATAARPAYAPGGTWTPRIEFSATLPFENGTMLVGFVEYRRLPDAIGDSPLVAGRDQTSIGVTFMRSF